MNSSRDARESPIAFGDLLLDRAGRRVTRAGVDIHLTPKALDLLQVLLEERPRALSKEELHRRIWPSTHVSEATLTALVGELREALGSDGLKEGFIRTVPRFGYAWNGGDQSAGAQGGFPAAASRRRHLGWVAGGTAALVLAALAVFAAVRLRPAAVPSAAGGGLDPEKIVVAVFVNQTGDASLDALGVQIADWATQSLARIQVNVAINPELPSLGGAPSPGVAAGDRHDPVRTLAHKAGAGLVLTGAYYLEGAETLRAQSQIIDATRDAIAVSFDPAVAPRSASSDLVAGVAQMAMTAMAARQPSGRGGSLPPDTRPPPYDAYLEGSQGWRSVALEPLKAERHFRRSLQLDPGFAFARIGLIYTLWMLQRYAEADEALRVLEEPAAYGRASPVEQVIIRAMRAGLDGRLWAYLEAHAELARLWPHPFNIYNLALREHDVGHPRAALEAMSRIRPADFPAGGAPLPPAHVHFWASLHHELGEYDKQLEVARLGEERYPGPGSTSFYTQEAGALVALGRMSEIEALILRGEKATMLPTGRGAILSYASRELAAHGHADQARKTAALAAAWFKAHLATRKPYPEIRDAYASNLLWGGDCQQALATYRDLSRGNPDDASYCAFQASYAVANVQCGSRDEALKIAAALEAADRPFRRGEHLFQRARVLAALGDADGAVRALSNAFYRGAPWSAMRLHLDMSWDAVRSAPPVIEWIKPRG